MIASFTRPTQACIDLKAIQTNIATIQASLDKEVKTFAVVKANAYGHGAVAVAKAVEHQVDGFCVSNLDEALELRQAGITGFILILGVIMPEQVAQAIAHDLTITVASLDWLNLAQSQQIDLSGLTCHIKVDTGMGRIGLTSAQDVNAVMAGLSRHGAKVTGIFTHFATADEKDATYFEKQLARFKQVLAGLDTVPDLVHASNSATSLWHKETVFNAVRLGIAIYGLNPSGQVLDLPCDLKPALRLTSQLVHVKAVAKGDHIGYGKTYQAGEEEWIGTLPIGYADGWIRQLQGFEVLVDGQACAIVGRVSMDQITIQLPRHYALGTPVVLIGQSGNTCVTATDIANYTGTINYEVLCLISDRVPRVYVH